MKHSYWHDAFSHNFPAEALGFEMKIVSWIHLPFGTLDVQSSIYREPNEPSGGAKKINQYIAH